MKLLDYIRGQRKGKDAHRIEKDSMTDPFLFDAIDGFDSVEDNHIERIEFLKNRLKPKSRRKLVVSQILQIAAVLGVIVFGLGGYLFLDYHKSDLQANNLTRSSIIEVYVPEPYYVENVTVVAKKNVSLAKAYRVDVSQFKVDMKVSPTVSDEEVESLVEVPIEIYLPDHSTKEDVVASDPDGKPIPVVGYDKYKLYLKNNLRRPTDQICANRHGNVYVDFSVDEYGRPYQMEVVQSLCGTSDIEAVRLVKDGPKWTKSSKRGRVKVEF